MSRPYLARVFMKQTGKTARDHLLELLVNCAEEMITGLGRNMKLAEVARQCGFANHPRMQRVFQRYVGVTPQRFRE